MSGLWLAIEEPAPVTARAEVGVGVGAGDGDVAWVDVGDGQCSDVVECDGFGDPIVDEDTLEPSPECGYNYEPAVDAGEHRGRVRRITSR